MLFKALKSLFLLFRFNIFSSNSLFSPSLYLFYFSNIVFFSINFLLKISLSSNFSDKIVFSSSNFDIFSILFSFSLNIFSYLSLNNLFSKKIKKYCINLIKIIDKYNDYLNLELKKSLFQFTLIVRPFKYFSF